MPIMHHTGMGLSSSSSGITLTGLVMSSFLYVRGWLRARAPSARTIPVWRGASFLFGMSLVWAVVGSPLTVYDHDLLTIHMIQHLLLMTFAPALILLGEPLLPIWHGLPQLGKIVVGPPFRWPLVQWLGRTLSRPALCWIVSASTLMGWHVPALFTLAMHSELGHSVEQASFLVAGLLFWWPVVQSWRSVSTGPQWWTLLYLFLATLPCDILSGFLVFSDRVAYPVYFSMPRHFGFSVLEDQQCAAALMWTCVTLAYLVPAAILSTRLLSPRSLFRGDCAQSEVCGSSAMSPGDPQHPEIV